MANTIEAAFVRFLREMGRDEPNIEDKQTLSTYYAPLFQPEIRTGEFLRIFAECFGEDGSICSDLPRPLICTGCSEKLIENIFMIIQYLQEPENHKGDNLRILDVIKNTILPRIEEVQEQITMVIEHQRATREPINTDIIFEFLGIDMTKYDPPSEKTMEKCNNHRYVKNDIDEACVVCQCDFEDGDEVKKLICDHQFHNNCIMGWLKNHSTCPMCNISLKEETMEVEVTQQPYNFLKTILGNKDRDEDNNDENENDSDNDDIDSEDSDNNDDRPAILRDLRNHGCVAIFVTPDGTLSYHLPDDNIGRDEIFVGMVCNHGHDSSECDSDTDEDIECDILKTCNQCKEECYCDMPGLDTVD